MVLTGLPVAGFTGSLAYRFDYRLAPRAPSACDAKTGTRATSTPSPGWPPTARGNAMAFVVAVDRAKEEDKLDAQQAVDRLAGDLAACRCSGG